MTTTETPEQAYFRRIEETFIRLRGTPFLLSPADWRLAQGWFEGGIPVEVVCRALEELFVQREERGAESKVQSLRYCAAAVEEAWRRHRQLGVAHSGGETYAVDVEARLARLAAALPADLPRRDTWARRIREAGAAAQEAEAALATLDRSLLEETLGRLSAEERRRLESEIDASLAALRERMSPKALAADRRRLVEERARRRAGLPLLSLFSPDALPDP